MITKAMAKRLWNFLIISAHYNIFLYFQVFFWHLQIIFDITGYILDCLKSTFITKLKNGENSGLVVR